MRACNVFVFELLRATWKFLTGDSETKSRCRALDTFLLRGRGYD